VILSEEKELTSDGIKKINYKQIDKKQKEIETEKHNMRTVEDSLTELETMRFVFSTINDKERLRERCDR
jgi:hypothetical protein